MDSKFEIIVGFRWVHTFILVDKPEFGRVQTLVFPDLGLGPTHFWLKRFEVWVSWRRSKGFEVQFWWMNLGLSEFEGQPVKFEAV